MTFTRRSAIVGSMLVTCGILSSVHAQELAPWEPDVLRDRLILALEGYNMGPERLADEEVKTPRVVQTLIEMVKHPYRTALRAAFLQAKRMGDPVPEHGDVLGEEDWPSVVGAIRLLCVNKVAEALPIILDLVDDSSYPKESRLAAVGGLGYYNSPEVAHAYEDILETDPKVDEILPERLGLVVDGISASMRTHPGKENCVITAELCLKIEAIRRHCATMSAAPSQGEGKGEMTPEAYSIEEKYLRILLDGMHRVLEVKSQESESTEDARTGDQHSDSLDHSDLDICRSSSERSDANETNQKRGSHSSVLLYAVCMSAIAALIITIVIVRRR